MNSRSPGRKSPRKRTVTSSSPDVGERLQERLRIALAEERAGVREPEAVAPRVLRPAKSSKSQPFGIVTTRPARMSPRVSSAIASAAVTIASACRATRCAIPARAFCFARAPTPSLERCACSASESRRSATHVAPVARLTAAPIRCTEPGGEVVSTTSIPSLPRDRDRLRYRGRVPGHVLVGQEQPAADRRRAQ